MDNQNNPNWPNNPPATPPLGGTPPPPNTFTPTAPAIQSEPSSVLPTSTWSTNLTPPSTTTLPPTTPPASPLPEIPTFPPPPDQSNLSNPTITTSPLDNPWNVPTQPPPIDGSPQNPTPTWVSNPTPPPTEIGSAPSTLGPTVPPTQPLSGAGPASNPTESVPTDLSHLISNNTPNNGGQNPSPSEAETLVMPQAPVTPEVPTIPTENHKGVPKWLIGVGISLLVMVAGASAYFILGIGQPAKLNESVPAQVTKQTVKTPPPVATPAPAVATGSANFGELEEGTQPATSAADLLRQRQGR